MGRSKYISSKILYSRVSVGKLSVSDCHAEGLGIESSRQKKKKSISQFIYSNIILTLNVSLARVDVGIAESALSSARTRTRERRAPQSD